MKSAKLWAIKLSDTFSNGERTHHVRKIYRTTVSTRLSSVFSSIMWKPTLIFLVLTSKKKRRGGRSPWQRERRERDQKSPACNCWTTSVVQTLELWQKHLKIIIWEIFCKFTTWSPKASFHYLETEKASKLISSSKSSYYYHNSLHITGFQRSHV